MQLLQSLLISLFLVASTTLVLAQCPSTSSDESGDTGATFNYDLSGAGGGVTACADLPANMTIGSGVYFLNACEDNDLANYVLDSGSPDVLPNTPEFGGSIGNCAYSAAGALRTVECPTTATASGGGNSYAFDISGANAPVCTDLPASITLGGVLFNQTACTDGVSATYLSSGAAVPLPFTVDFGGAVGMCQYDGAGALPIEWLYLKAEKHIRKVLLRWATASEADNSGFEVQHSTDGRNWETLSFIEGNGTTVNISQYQYTHEMPAIGVNYYWLKQIDFDGRVQHSDIVSVTMEDATQQLIITPNPVTNGHVTVSLGAGDFQSGTLSIYDSMGRQVKVQQLSHAQMIVSIDGLPQGIYVVEVMMNGRRLLERMMVR